MKYYKIQEFNKELDKWFFVPFAEGSRTFVDGYMTCLVGFYPSPKYRILCDGIVVEEIHEKSAPRVN